ncbi:MAG: hypothetical protein KJ578_11385 [Bacteroidetes bacterium]|nr:hypothetical protein [Bacteroidota bacterium]
MNNPLKYTDPSGYSYKPAYWNVGTNGAFYVNHYANSGPTGLIGPGSNNHWSDPYRTENSSWWLGNEASFDSKYGEGAYDSYYNQHYTQQTSENTISNGDVSNNNELSTAWVQVGFFYYDSNGNPIVGEDGTYGQFWVYEASVIDGSNLDDAFWGDSFGTAISHAALVLAPGWSAAYGEPTFWGEVAMGVATLTYATYLYLNSTSKFPKPWYTHRPNNYIPAPLNGPNNKNYFPQGNGNDFIKWTIRLGGAAVLGKKLYDGFNYKPHVLPADNTNVIYPAPPPPFYTPIPNPNWP